jgi:hypothetical protein
LSQQKIKPKTSKKIARSFVAAKPESETKRLKPSGNATANLVAPSGQRCPKLQISQPVPQAGEYLRTPVPAQNVVQTPKVEEEKRHRVSRDPDHLGSTGR